LTRSLLADFGYIGSNQSHLAFTKDINQVPENLLGPNDAAFRPYPFQSLNGYTTEGISNYHAFQTGLTQRFKQGLMFNFNYTWSHMLTNQDSSGWGTLQGATAYQRAYDPMANYGNSNFDIRHMFKAHGSFDLPFGSGRSFANTNKILDKAIGGWTLFADFIAQGGSPFTPRMQVNNSYALSSGSFVWYPNVVGDPTAVPGGQTIDHWFNVGAFAAPTPGTFGNMGRNILRGPKLSSINMSLHKTFRFTEAMKLDFSANATNVVNHPSFRLPDNLIGPGHVGRIDGVSVPARQMELVAKIVF
jgi:hypothetical protein